MAASVQGQAGRAAAVVRARPWLQELKVIFGLALPTIVQTTAQQAMVFTDSVFVGHIGTHELAAAAIGNMYNSFLTTFLLGAATALDTLGATAHGATTSKVQGVTTLATWTATAAIVITVLCIPVLVLLSVAGPFARGVLRQDAEVAHLVAKFCWGLMPGVCPMMWSTILMKFLQVQGVVIAPAVVTACTFALNIGINFAFIGAAGFQGAPFATSFSQTMQFLGLSAMVITFVATRPARMAYRQQRERLAANPELQQPQGLTAGGNQAWGMRLLGILFTGASDVSLEATECPVAAPLTLEHSQQADIAVDNCAAAAPNSTAASPVASITVPAAREKEDCMALGSADGSGPHATPPDTCAICVPPSASKLAAKGFADDDDSSRSGEMQRRDSGSSSSQHGQVHKVTLRHMRAKVRTACAAGAARGRLWTYLKLGLPGGAFLCFEFASFQVTTSLAAQLGNIETAAHAAMMNIINLTYIAVPFAVSIAASIRVGNLLGAGAPETARLSSRLSVGIGVVFMVCCGVVLMAAKDHIGSIFSGDQQVVDTVATIVPMAALFQVADGVLGPAQGVLRGCGKQTLLMVTTIAGFWGGGVLLGALLCFEADLGLKGIWWGIASGVITTALMTLGAMLLLKWPLESQRAQARLQSSPASSVPAVGEVAVALAAAPANGGTAAAAGHEQPSSS